MLRSITKNARNMQLLIALVVWLVPVGLSAIFARAMLPNDSVMADLLNELKYPPLWLPLINIFVCLEIFLRFIKKIKINVVATKSNIIEFYIKVRRKYIRKEQTGFLVTIFGNIIKIKFSALLYGKFIS